MDYLKDPAAIYAKSFATIQREVDFSSLPADMVSVAERMIHACGMVDLINDIAFSENFVSRASAALKRGAPVLCDCEMVRSGVISTFLTAGNEIMTTLKDDRVPVLAQQLKTTRSAAQTALWVDHLDGAIVVIGNAPTALFALLERLDEGSPKPAAILACPVGFVGAEESKTELCENPRGVPFLTIKGRRGGSAITAAALNAITKASSDQVAA